MIVALNLTYIEFSSRFWGVAVFDEFFYGIAVFAEFFAVLRCSEPPNVPLIVVKNDTTCFFSVLINKFLIKKPKPCIALW